MSRACARAASWARSSASSCASATPRPRRCSTTRSRSRCPPERARAAAARRTEGWAAGLYLAGLSLRDRPGAGAGAEDLGYDRHLVDYLGDEVLSAQEPQARAFLLDTCVLDRFSAPLCDAVRGDGRVEARCWARSSGRTSSSSRSTSAASGSATTTSSARSCAASSRTPARPSTSPSCTRGPARGCARTRRRLGAPSPTCSRPGARRDAADLIADVVERVAAERAQRHGRSAGSTRCRPTSSTGDPRLCLARAWLALDSGEPAAAERWADATAAADDGRAAAGGRRDGGVERGDAARDAGLSGRRPQRRRGARRAGGGARGRRPSRRGGPSRWRRSARRATSAAPRPTRSRALLEQAVGDRAGRAPTAWRCCARRGRSPRSRFAAGDRRRRAAGGSPPPTRCARSSRSRSTGWGRWRPPSPASSPPTPASSSRPASGCERAVVLRPARRRPAGADLRARRPRAGPGDAGRRRRGRGDAAQRAGRAARVAEPRHVRAPRSTTSERRLRGKAARGSPAEVEELSAREMSVLRLLGSELSIAEIGERALHLAQHGQDPRARDLPQARRRHARGAVARARELRLL